MSDENPIIDTHLKAIQDIADYQRILIEENAALKSENLQLKDELKELSETKEKLSKLEIKVQHARKNNKSFQRIEELEEQVKAFEDAIRHSLSEIEKLNIQRDNDMLALSNAQEFASRLMQFAKKLGIKQGNRRPLDLLNAVDDAIRKLI